MKLDILDELPYKWNPYIIRTSDRGKFKRCRQEWDFSSKIRKFHQYVPGAEALDFGTAIHAGLEVVYDPNRQGDNVTVIELEAQQAFVDSMHEWKRQLIKAERWDRTAAKWAELIILGKRMLNHYLMWIEDHDDEWSPLLVEQDFEVPIPCSTKDIHNKFGNRFTASPIYGMLGTFLHIYDREIASYVPVLYQGRIDAVFHNNITDSLWIWDHKTTASFGDTDHFDINDQAGGYYWVCKTVLNLDVQGVIFNQLRKKAPKPPKLLKNGGFSKAMQQDTTTLIYKRAIEEAGLNLADYADFLSKFEDREFVRRIETFRSVDELEQIRMHIITEAMDMLDDPSIYPNPSEMNCRYCSFKIPCQMAMDGSDAEWYLENANLYEVGKR